MKTKSNSSFILIVSFLAIFTTIITSHAAQSVSAEYGYYVAGHDYQYSSVNYMLNHIQHNFTMNYSRADNMDPDYALLQQAALGYLYTSEQNIIGAYINSSSDEPFTSIDVTDIIGIYGHSVYSKVLGDSEYVTPDGNKVQMKRQANLYIGLGAASKPVFSKTNIIPVISYIYQGTFLVFRAGIPETSVTMNFNNQHKLNLLLDTSGDLSTHYYYTPTSKDTLSLQYIIEKNTYYPHERVLEKGMRNYGIRYRENWFRAEYTRLLPQNIEVTGTIGYMPLGYRFVGKHFHSSHSREVDKKMQYSVGLKYNF